MLSIIIPTLGRLKEVESLLISIRKYVYDKKIDFEVIIIDQNFSDSLDELVLKYAKIFAIKHHKVSFRGLSKAKNYGANYAVGEYIIFVDDDAEFLENTLDVAIKELETGRYDVVSGKCVDRTGADSVLKFGVSDTILSFKDFEGKFIESTMFFKKEICQKYKYDENMGVGTFYGAEEGYDLVYRMLQDGIKILFCPSIKFYHPQTISDRNNELAIRRSFSYRCGFGYLCRKHGLRKKFHIRIFKLIGYLLILPLYRPRYFKFYFADLLGSIVGYYL